MRSESVTSAHLTTDLGGTQATHVRTAERTRRFLPSAHRWIALLLLAFGMPLPSQATPPPNQFCVYGAEEWCYAKLEDAEAAIRTGQFSSHPADALLQHTFTIYKEDGTIDLI